MTIRNLYSRSFALICGYSFSHRRRARRAEILTTTDSPRRTVANDDNLVCSASLLGSAASGAV
jgi:hypothetical protein